MSSESESTKDQSIEQMNKSSDNNTEDTTSEDSQDKESNVENNGKSNDKAEVDAKAVSDKFADTEKKEQKDVQVKDENKPETSEISEKENKHENNDSKTENDSEEAEDSEEDKKASDQPVEQSSIRDRKKVQRLNDDTPTSDTKEVKTDIPAGSGVQLGEIPRIDASISRFKNDDLKLLHRLLYKTPGKTTLIKKNIRKFNGFDFKKESDEYNKKIEATKKFELKQLKSICEMLDLEKKGTKDEIVERVVEFLLEPKDSGKAVGGGRPKRTAAVRANNRGYSSHDDSYSSDERRTLRGGRGKGKRLNLKDETTSESDEEFHPSDTSESRSRVAKRKKGGRKKQESDDEDDDDVSEVDESATSEDTDDEPRKRKKNSKKVVNNKGKGKPTAIKQRGRKPTAEAEKKTPKKVNRKRDRTNSEDSEDDEENVSSSEDEPLIKKTKSPQPPTDEEIKKYVKEILDGANLEEITMKTVCKQVYAHYPDFDLAHKKEFIKSTVKSLIST